MLRPVQVNAFAPDYWGGELYHDVDKAFYKVGSGSVNRKHTVHKGRRHLGGQCLTRCAGAHCFRVRCLAMVPFGSAAIGRS
jgi:hypothetical protein